MLGKIGRAVDVNLYLIARAEKWLISGQRLSKNCCLYRCIRLLPPIFRNGVVLCEPNIKRNRDNSNQQARKREEKRKIWNVV